MKRLEKMTARDLKALVEPSWSLQSSLLKSNLHWLTITSINTQSVCDGRLNEDSVAWVTSDLRFLLSCDSAVAFKSLHSERSPCPSIISTWRWWVDGLGVRMKAREEAHTLNHLMVLSFREGLKVTQKLKTLTPERPSKGKSPQGEGSASSLPN